MEKNNETESLIFLNTPITSDINDVIGVRTYVEKLDAAIDAGAQMIAVTSPFGSGKTSVAELLEKKRSDKKREKIIKISMWSQFHGDNKNGSTTNLHRSFFYQIASQINHKRGTYINRRLSPNYGLIKIHANKTRYWILFLIAILQVSLSWSIHTFPSQLASILPFLENNIDSWVTGLSLSGVALVLFVITRAEIIFSASQKAEQKREIESAEIIDLYRDEILKYKCWMCKKGLLYIVIIEDLDRTSDSKAVIGFLKELRKYYIPGKDTSNTDISHRNKVVFVVNVKPEALLMGQENASDCTNDLESLYAKLFDYVLNLQTINIDNYDAILEGLLEEKKELIKQLGLPIEDNLVDIPGMKWIIRERRLGIREIKERLNIAFSLYESLKSKFSQSPIAFEKCAVVAYLTTAFELDLSNTKDRAFQQLVNLSLQNKLTDENCSKCLQDASTEYVSTVKELIIAKLIDNGYRTYFYNYPQGSYLYSSDESQIIGAILYSEHVDDLDQIAQRVITSNSLATERAFRTLEQLGLPLPQTVFQSETLYIEALKQSCEKVFLFIDGMDYSNDSIAKTIAFFRKILTYDKERKTYKEDYADRLCKNWESHFSEKALLQLRAMLCKEFASEIIWYRPLFFGVHALIKIEEMDMISLKDAIALINLDNEEFTVDLVKYIQSRFAQHTNTNSDEQKNVENFIRSSGKYLRVQVIVPLYLDYMDTICHIVPDFEKETFNLIIDMNEKIEVKNQVFSLYQNIINKTANIRLSEQTLNFICKIDCYNGYSSDVAIQLDENKLYLEFVLILLHQTSPIPFDRIEIKEALENDVEWLVEHTEYFVPIREQVAKCQANTLLQYSFMFSNECPVLTENELQSIQNNIENSDPIVLKLVSAEKITEDNYEILGKYFSRKKQTNNLTYDILVYISKLSSKIVKTFFYSLDFDMVRYRYIAASKKQQIKQAYYDILELGVPSEKIHFMKATKFLDTAWETELLELLKTNSDLQNSYIEIVNNSEIITKNTIQTICKLGKIHAMSLLVNLKLFENKKYSEYVVSNTLRNSRFDLAEGEQKDELWSTYIKIFSSSDFSITRKYMSKNSAFLRCIMSNKLYQGLEEENRMQLHEVYQDKDSITNVLEYGIDFALQYYSSMGGFLDEDAATAFVTIVEGSMELIASDELYNYTHDMLINGKLKARYTNVRKKNGYGKQK